VFGGSKHGKFEPGLSKYLESVTRARLKSQQRLIILREYLLPRLFHRLELGKVTASTLVSMDRCVRSEVRRWLRLPHDVTMAYFQFRLRRVVLGSPDLNL
jgi:hypothetical protein